MVVCSSGGLQLMPDVDVNPTQDNRSLSEMGVGREWVCSCRQIQQTLACRCWGSRCRI